MNLQLLVETLGIDITDGKKFREFVLSLGDLKAVSNTSGHSYGTAPFKVNENFIFRPSGSSYYFINLKKVAKGNIQGNSITLSELEPIKIDIQKFLKEAIINLESDLKFRENRIKVFKDKINLAKKYKSKDMELFAEKIVDYYDLSPEEIETIKEFHNSY